MAPRELIFVTGNANKVSEVRAMLGDVVVLRNRSLDLDELQGTMEEISKDKCRRAADIVRSTRPRTTCCFEL
jgi:inosine triphosphate pyrophosphatase